MFLDALLRRPQRRTQTRLRQARPMTKAELLRVDAVSRLERLMPPGSVTSAPTRGLASMSHPLRDRRFAGENEELPSTD